MRTNTNPNREALKAISQPLKPLIKEGAFNTINEALIEIVYKKDGHETFNTFNQWKHLGYTVKKGAKAFILWAQPVSLPVSKSEEKEESEADEFSYFPLCYLFSNLQVYKKEAANDN